MEEQMTKQTLNVPNISCQHCVANIKRAVTKLPGVDQVEGDPEKKQITIVYDENQIDLGAIEKAMENAGYPAA
jgi:copper ion binding protein